MYLKTTMHPINLSIINNPYLSLEENNFVLMLKIKKTNYCTIKIFIITLQSGSASRSESS